MSRSRKTSRKTSIFIIFIVFIVGLFWLRPALADATGLNDDPRQAVKQAWLRANEIGNYDYRSTAKQITYPAPAISNAGKSPVEDNIAAEGHFGTNDEFLNFTIWPDGSFNPDTGIEIRSDGEKTWGRRGQSEWEEMQDVTGSFSPGGDPLGFLYGMRNIEYVGADVHSFSQTDMELTFQRYTFDFNGPAFGRFLADSSEEAMRQQGELPQGIELDIPEIYAQATGNGELWLDESGLPARLKVSINYGRQENGETLESHITTDYFNYNMETVANQTVFFFDDPSTWLSLRSNFLSTPDFQQQFYQALGFTLFFVVLMLIIVRYWQTRTFYATFSCLMITAMLVGPLLHAEQVHAFGEQQQARLASQEVFQTQAQEQQDAVQASTSTNFDPLVNPLTGSQTYMNATSVSEATNLSPISPLASVPAAAQAQVVDATDTDGDGLSDVDEDEAGSCSGVPALDADVEGDFNHPIDCATVDTADTDGDGLTDAEEVLILGTIPAYVDTDGDSIEDGLEVEGFSYNNTQWYLNPNESDSNKDGILDGMECLDWSLSNPTPDFTAICPDTDGDGNPDLFDDDNDGDGVEDRVDHSPFNIYEGFTQDTPFVIDVDNVEKDRPVLVTIELRPEQAENLAYFGHVLDWPADDRLGQIQRVYTTTWATTAEYTSSADNADNGDIRVTPMLEISIPTTSDNPGNLPLLPGIQRTQGMTVSQWLDADALSGYGVTVIDVLDDNGNPTGALTAYAPVAPFSNADGDATAGFASKMYYEPSQALAGDATLADWGAAHEYRLVWLVEMLTDPCPDGKSECEDSERLQDQYTIIHNYYDDWNLTGFSLSEQHGLEAAIIAKNPNNLGTNNDLNYPAELANLAWMLSGTFVTGQDCGAITVEQAGTNCTPDGNRDVTIANMQTAMNTWIDNSNLLIYSAVSYPHKDNLLNVASDEAKLMLDNYTTNFADATPTLLFAHEYTERSIGMDTPQGGGGISPLLDMDGVVPKTMAGINWGTYQMANGAWEEVSVEDYLTELDALLQQNEPYFTADDSQNGLDSEADYATAAQGKRMFMQFLYSSVHAGLNGMVAVDGVGIPTVNAYWSVWLPTTGSNIGFASDVVKDFGSSLGENILSDTFWKAFSDSYIKERNFLVSGNDFDLRSSSGSSLRKATAMTNVLGSAIALASIATFTAAIFCPSCEWVGVIINSVEIISNLADMAGMLRTFVILKGFSSVANFTKTMQAVAGSGFVITIVVAVITIAVLWAIYLVQYADKPNSVDKQMAITFTHAATVVTIAFTLVSLLLIAVAAAATGVGAVIAVVLLIFLAVLGIWEAVCGLVGCTGPISAITEWFAERATKTDYYIINMESADRLDISYEDLQLTDADLGYTSANQLHYTMRVINTLETYEEPDAANTRRANFQYTLQENDQDPFPDLTINDNPIPACPASPTCYEVIDSIRTEPREVCVEYEQIKEESDDGGEYYRDGKCLEWGTEDIPITGVRMSTTASHDVALTAYEGINANIGGHLIVGESFSIPYELCSGECNVYGTKETSEEEAPGWNPISLGQSQTFDILPPTLYEFVSLTWNDNGTIAFPSQTDADNDGLSAEVDPDDSHGDGDGDGLSDEYEIYLDTDTTSIDSDGDGLSDDDEIRYDTDPALDDTDGDGLIDGEEIGGWLFTYRVAADGTPVQTRVWSDPLLRDTDNDGLSDLQERLLSFNPIVADDPSIVENLIQIDDFEVDEAMAPWAIWHFDEAELATAFADGSGEGLTAVCDSSAGHCPTAGVDGRFGQALDFDGVDDSVTALTNPTLANQSFTISAWAKRDGTGNDIIFSHGQFGNNTQNKFLNFGFNNNDNFVCGFKNNNLVTAATHTDTGWTHWACTYDAETNERHIYRNGQDVATDIATEDYLGQGPLSIGVQIDGNNHFDGLLDDVALYRGALSQLMIDGLVYGGYYLNDLYVLPGAELDYQVTLTNTHTEDASGLLFNETNTFQPILDAESVDNSNGQTTYEALLAPPQVVLHMDTNDFNTTFVNSTDDTFSATCRLTSYTGDGTCPTPALNVEVPSGRLGDAGKYNRPVGGLGEIMGFDGVDDFISIPSMSISPSVVVGFWVRFESLPTGTDKAYLLYSEPGVGYSLYVDQQGYVYYDNGNTVTKMVDFQGDGDIQFTAGKWHHLLIKTSTSNWGEFLFSPAYDDYAVGGDFVGDDGYPFLAHIALPPVSPPQFGPGLIGNNAVGDGPFHGQIATFALYQSPVQVAGGDDPFSLLDSDNTTGWLEMRENGAYVFDGECNDSECEVAPTLLLKFEQYVFDESLIGVRNSINGAQAYCETLQTCPLPDPNGHYNEALRFDGNDSLMLDGIELDNRSFTIAAWAKRDSLGTTDYIVSQGESSANLGLHFGFRGNNQFTCAFWANDLNTPASYTDTGWNHWACSYDAATNSLRIYRNGELVANGATTVDYQGTGPLFIGKAFNSNPFNGSLDEIVIIPDALDEDGVGAMILANSAYPVVHFDNDTQLFTLPAGSELTLSGTIQIDEEAASQVQRLWQQVDASVEVAGSLTPASINDSNLRFYLPLNEDADSSEFNEVGSSLNNATCVVDCPAGGFAGALGRSVYFDGIDDGLKIENGVPTMNTDEELIFSAWVKADQGTLLDMREMGSRSLGDFIGWNGLEIDFDGAKLHGRNNTYLMPYSLSPNEWTHLGLVIFESGVNWLADVFVNGEYIASYQIPKSEVPSLGSGLAVVGMQKNYAHLLHGHLDEVYVYAGNLTLNPRLYVEALYQARPHINMHFDAGANEATTVGEFGTIATPSDSAAVALGVDGRLGNAVEFNGQGHLAIENESVPSNFNDDFTIMAWIKTDQNGSGLLVKSNDNAAWESGEKAFYIDTSGNVAFSGSNQILSNYAVTDNRWHHVAVVWDRDQSGTGGTGYIYVDGQDVTNGVTYNAGTAENATHTLKIGAPNYNSSEAPNAFNGLIDELTLYGRALTSAEVVEAYQWEFRTFREVSSAFIHIDDEQPTIVVDSQWALRANTPVIFPVEARDETSPIVRMSSNHLDGLGWQDVPRCIDNANFWCPLFRPTGEGENHLFLAAVDSVGHWIGYAVAFLVDDTAPAATLNSNLDNQLLDANRPSDTELRWLLPLAGTINDPTLSGTNNVAGSGVATDTVAIQLRDAAGNIVGNSTQRVTVDATAGTWAVDFEFFTIPPFGQYSVELIAEDTLGNQIAEANRQIGTIWLDERTPLVKYLSGQVDGVPFDPTLPASVALTSTAVTPSMITGTLSIGGIATTGAGWSNAALYYHLEDSDLTGDIQDASGNNRQAFCVNCPTLLTDSSPYGQAFTFDGTSQALETRGDFTTLGDGSFTVSAWVNHNGSGDWNNIIAQKADGGTIPGWTLRLNDDNRAALFVANGSARWDAVSTETIPANQWVHLTGVVDRAANEVRLYVDGQEVSVQTDLTGSLANTSALVIGAWDNSGNPDYFSGSLDEISLYNRALSAEQIVAMSRPPVSTITAVEIRVQALDLDGGTDPATVIDWTPVALENANSSVTRWSYSEADTSLEGYYQIQLRSIDSSGNVARGGTIWRGYIDRTHQLVAHWTFEEGSGTVAIDASGNGHDATSANFPSYTTDVAPTTFTNTSALSFNGVDDVLSTGNSPLPEIGDAQALSIAAWVNPDDITTPNIQRFVTLAGGANPTAILRIDNQRLHFYVIVDGVFKHVRVSNVLIEGVYQHVAGTYDGQTLRVYHNGVEVGSLEAPGTIVSPTYAALSSGGEPFAGKMDDVRIYAHALTVQEVSNLAANVSPIASWSFDEGSGTTTADATGNGHDGTLNGNMVWSQDTESGSGYSLAFDGVDDYISITDGVDENLSQNASMTWSVWVKPTWASGAPGWNPGVIGIRDINNTRMSLHIRKDYSGIDTWDGNSVKYYPVSLLAHNWYHIVVTWDENSNEESVYLNGTLINKTNRTLDTTTSGLPLHIGSSNGQSEFFTGLIDEVEIYTRVLSEDEVLALAMKTPLVSWSFDEGSGTTTADATGNGNDGTLNGDMVWSEDTESGSGYSLAFDGVDDHVSVPHVVNPGSNTFTAMAWFKVTDLNTTRYILQQEDGTGAGRTWLYLSKSGQLGTYLGNSALFSTASITIGEWHHAAVSYDGTTLRLYLDGQLEASEERILEASDGGMLVGVHKGMTTRFLGNIDEVQIYNSVLSDAQIAAWHDGSLNPLSGTAVGSSASIAAIGGVLALLLAGFYLVKRSQIRNRYQ